MKDMTATKPLAKFSDRDLSEELAYRKEAAEESWRMLTHIYDRQSQRTACRPFDFNNGVCTSPLAVAGTHIVIQKIGYGACAPCETCMRAFMAKAESEIRDAEIQLNIAKSLSNMKEWKTQS